MAPLGLGPAAAASTGAATAAAGVVAAAAASATSRAGEGRSPVGEQLARTLLNGGGTIEDFRPLCAALGAYVKQATEADSSLLAEALLSAMKRYLNKEEYSEYCLPLVTALDEFCAHRDCVRYLPTEVLRGLLMEFLQNLQHSSWTKLVADGALLLKKLNMSCVMLLCGAKRATAYRLLLEVASDDAQAISSSLLVKCLRKLNKSLGQGRGHEQEVRAVLDTIHDWLQQVLSRGSRALRNDTIVEGIREIVEAASRVCPNATATWAADAAGDVGCLLRSWMTPPPEKENVLELTVEKAAADPSSQTMAPATPVKVLPVSPTRQRSSLSTLHNVDP